MSRKQDHISTGVPPHQGCCLPACSLLRVKVLLNRKETRCDGFKSLQLSLELRDACQTQSQIQKRLAERSSQVEASSLGF